MQFGNPVVGGLFLVRAAIRSPNYVQGVSGWTINQDGTVEFASGTFRGLLAIGNATYLIKIGDTFGRLQFLNGAGTIEHGALYDASTAQLYSTVLIARNFNTVPADPPGAIISLNGDNDTVSTGPQISIATFNPEARPNERIDLTSALVRILAASFTTSGAATIGGALAASGALSATGNFTITGGGVNNIGGGTNLNGDVAITGLCNVLGNPGLTVSKHIVTSAGQIYSEYNQPSASWSDAGLVASNASGGSAALALRTTVYAAQARLGTGANDVYWRDQGDSAYIGHQASAYTVASREATKTAIAPMVGDAMERIRILEPITYRQDVTPPEAADRLHLAHPDVRKLGPVAALRAIQAIDESRATHAGFTVENVATAFPEAVALDEDGKPGGYDLAAMVAALVHAVQQLDVRVTALSTTVTPPNG